MERESFEDAEVAALLNEHFVSVKVDREERPDVDHLYMAVCQAMTGQGGWPLTVILTPDKKPFFAGTYFPKNKKYGRYGLMDILPQVVKQWEEEPERIADAAEQITEETKRQMLSRLEGEVGEEALATAYEMYAQTFDSQYGGFGSAPKFPTPHNLSFLMRYARHANEPHALEMAEQTLHAMYRGGLYDHIGFGFARYSTDERWLVPHFEKMLYDNALLAMTYTEAYQLTRKPLYRQAAEGILTYVLRDMTDPEGGFYSAEDADSEGEEGRFYVWTEVEIMDVLGEEDGELYCELYDVTDEGNFEGRSIPNLLTYRPDQYARLRGLDERELAKRLEEMRRKLFEAREKRVHPGKDDKILTSWNGLMIMALAKAAKAFGKPDYSIAAKRAAEFVRTRLVRDDGRLLARYRDGESAYPGYLDDYAYMIWGLIDLYEATFETEYLREAVRFSEAMIELFWDEQDGGFFFNGKDAEQLLSRIKEIYDGAQPSGNSVAALNLARLGAMTGEERFMGYAERTIQAFGGSVERYPSGHSVLLAAMMLASGSRKEIVLAGDDGDDAYEEFKRVLREAFLPHAVITSSNGEAMPLTQGKGKVDGKPAVYICENFACQSPLTELADLAAWLERARIQA